MNVTKADTLLRSAGFEAVGTMAATWGTETRFCLYRLSDYSESVIIRIDSNDNIVEVFTDTRLSIADKPFDYSALLN